MMTYLVFFVWAKSMIAYFGVFNLRSVGIAEYLMMIINPIGFTFTCFAILLFIRRTSLYYIATFILTIIANVLLYLNVLYYREFTDFVTIDTVTGGAGMFQHGFDFGSVPVHLMDWVYWIDLIVIVVLIIAKKIKFDERPIGAKRAFTYTSLGLAMFGLNFWAGDALKNQLILRRAQSDKTYVVRYLGLGPWMLTNGYYTHMVNTERKDANKSTLEEVQKYIASDRYLSPNIEMYGIAKNKNVIEIHLESFQQDLIDLKIKGTDGKEHVVTPFLNSVYHSNQTYSFSNFFNQVGQGKTSDAETMLETSTFGLPAGSLFAKYGSTQTFQAMPAILAQQDGYSSAVFHGNAGAFYNRINTYKQMGYDNFFDQSFYDNSSENMSPWGIKDKVFFEDSVQYLEQMQQPFYTKFLTVTNHLNYELGDSDKDPNFATVDSGSKVVDGYFETAHYLDQAVEEFFTYLKNSGLYDKSIIVLYGDHYGISGSDTKTFLQYLGKDPDNVTAYDNTMLQRTPFMVHIPGQTNGHIISTYTGEIDVMPTLEHLLGVDTKSYIQFGQDMFASGRQDYVALRNGGFVTPTITLPSLNSRHYYDTQTGLEIDELSEAQEAYVKEIKSKVSTMLSMSDKVNNQNLLRFYQPDGFKTVNSSDYDYNVKATKKRLKEENEVLAAKSTSLISQNQGKSTISDYPTVKK
ncbi:LTA synthase family protein [Lactococcus sp.]|uniref:LTA synthase family protein n=1 Tax=Lactococcus sp. TaxID=44273 RepID=UPI0035AE0E82